MERGLKPFLLALLVGSVVVTSGCCKKHYDQLKKFAREKPKSALVAAGAVAAAGAHYFYDSFGLKSKKEDAPKVSEETE